MRSGAPDLGWDSEAVTEAPEEDSGGYEIAICVYPDGTFAVKKQPLPDEARESEEPPKPGAPGSAPEPTEPITNFKDALLQALKIFKANPADSEIRSGFKAGFAANKPESPY